MTLDDSLAGLRALVALADAGSFSAAAQHLRLSRSAISKAVARLEQRLGRRLVERSSRALQLSAEGRALLHHARRALDELAAAEDLLAGDAARIDGLVRLELPPMFGRQWVLPVLFALADAHRGLQFDVGFSARTSELVGEGIDLAVRIGHLADRAELIARPLGVQPTLLVAAPGYIQRHGTPADVAALQAHACLRESASDCWDWLPSPLLAPPGLILRDSAALLEAARAGHGIARVPAWMARPLLDAGQLHAVLPALACPALPIHALWPRGRFLPRRVRCVIDALLQAFARHPDFAPAVAG
jgi:DNA-binding transcriptional LysR family regulator